MKNLKTFKSFISILLIVTLLSFFYSRNNAQEKVVKCHPVYNVIDYGVTDDGTTINTIKIQQLIDKVADLGGGVIYFPPGKYLTGTIYLKSYINLQIESGATILGSLDINNYVPVGEEKLNHSARQERHLINGIDLIGVAITGRGMIDGRGYKFWPEDFRTMTEIKRNCFQVIRLKFS